MPPGSNVGAPDPEGMRARVLGLTATKISKDTKRNYLQKVAQLGKRFDRVNGNSWPGYVDWLIAQKPTWSASTWRLYKAASIYVGMRHARSGTAASGDMEATLRLASESQTGSHARGRATSAHKHKRMPPKDREMILARLDVSPSSYAQPLRNFVHAGLLTGLRPVEWAAAALREVPGQSAVLRVQNAKDSQGRAHGPFRHLTWSGLSDTHRHAILATIGNARRVGGESDGIKLWTKSLQRLLRETCQSIWPRRARGYTLYDCRHEFAARAKLLYEPEEVAALMGHATDETASKHYGRMSATGSIDHAYPLPVPDPEEVERIRKLYRKNAFHLRGEGGEPTLQGTLK